MAFNGVLIRAINGQLTVNGEPKAFMENPTRAAAFSTFSAFGTKKF